MHLNAGDASAEEWGNKGTPRAGKSLDERFDGAWRKNSPEQQTQQSEGAGLFSARANTGGNSKLADQFAGPAASARYMQQTEPQQDFAPNQKFERQPYKESASDPALPPIQGTSDQGLSVPKGSEVPQASRDIHQVSQSEAPASGYNAAPASQIGEPFSGFPESGPGLSSQKSKDVNLARPREQLPSVNVNSGIGAQPASGQSNVPLPKGSGSSNFQTATPKSAAGAQPTSIDSPSKTQALTMT